MLASLQMQQPRANMLYGQHRGSFQQDEWDEVLQEMGVSDVELRDSRSYDAVLLLVTAVSQAR